MGSLNLLEDTTLSHEQKQLLRVAQLCGEQLMVRAVFHTLHAAAIKERERIENRKCHCGFSLYYLQLRCLSTMCWIEQSWMKEKYSSSVHSLTCTSCLRIHWRVSALLQQARASVRYYKEVTEPPNIWEQS